MYTLTLPASDTDFLLPLDLLSQDLSELHQTFQIEFQA
jgi:hypothetical protein